MDTRIQYLQGDAPEYKVQAIQALYGRYAGMLLGYIMDVVQDEKLAEQYLADTFSALPLQPGDFLKPDENAYCKLQLLARAKLANHFTVCTEQPDSGTPLRTNKYIDLMTPDQQQIFCGIHYQGKNIDALATALTITKDEARKLLKEAFLIIRNNTGDAARVH